MRWYCARVWYTYYIGKKPLEIKEITMTTSTEFRTEVGLKLPMENGTFAVIDTGSLLIFPTESSAIKEITYLTDSSVLVVLFKSSTTRYFYQAVPATVVMQLLVAKSFGGFINAHIKPNYEFYSF